MGSSCSYVVFNIQPKIRKNGQPQTWGLYDRGNIKHSHESYLRGSQCGIRILRRKKSVPPPGYLVHFKPFLSVGICCQKKICWKTTSTGRDQAYFGALNEYVVPFCSYIPVLGHCSTMAGIGRPKAVITIVFIRF